jgi:hypothetical protein
VAVLKLAPFARILRGRISGGYSQGIGPHEAPKAPLYIITNMTTSFGVACMSKKRKYDMSDKEMIIATAPERRIGRRPQRSTKYHGGIVQSK